MSRFSASQISLVKQYKFETCKQSHNCCIVLMNAYDDTASKVVANIYELMEINYIIYIQCVHLKIFFVRMHYTHGFSYTHTRTRTPHTQPHSLSFAGEDFFANYMVLHHHCVITCDSNAEYMTASYHSV